MERYKYSIYKYIFIQTDHISNYPYIGDFHAQLRRLIYMLNDRPHRLQWAQQPER